MCSFAKMAVGIADGGLVMEERRKLPKNVRQVGERDEVYRIYLEDYVGTYLEKCMSRQGELTLGVLVGESCCVEGNACLFVTGAMEVNHVWGDGDQLLFSEYSWERMLDTKSRHFPESEICGCFVCAGEEIIPEGAVLGKLLNRYFPESGSVMLVQSREDSAVYYQGMTGMSRLSGYYIYYEQNKAMQRFLVENSQGRVVERTGDETVVNQFREKMTEKKNMRSPAGLRMAYGLCACLALAVCAIGFNTLGSSQKIAQMEEQLQGFMQNQVEVGATISQTDGEGGKLTIYDVTGGATEQSTEAAATTAQTDDATQEEAVGSEAQTESNQESVDVGQAEESGEPVDVGQAEESGEPVDVGQAEESGAPVDVLPGEESEAPVSVLPEGCTLYTVQKGDTLSSICVALYGSHEQLEHICELNGLADPNLISLGQELIVPVINQPVESEAVSE
jgi:LysM repeat protein